MPREDDNKQLSHAHYWDGRYEADIHHEWFLNFAALKPLFDKVLPGPKLDHRLLHLGCGTSTLTADLHAIGYHNQLNVDFAASAIEIMRTRYAELEGVEWMVADVRHMDSVPNASIDVALDKGTMDAMLYGSLWDPEDEVKANVSAYIGEVIRVLAQDGMFVYVSYRQPHFLKPLLERKAVWHLKVEAIQATKGAFEYFGYTMTKDAKLKSTTTETT